MRLLKILLIVTLVLAFTFCSGKRYKTELSFANKLAKDGLWKEAYMRWQRVQTAGHDSAALHNNMAVALEQMGKPREAQKEYEQALKMAPGNQNITRNYDRLKRFLDIKKRRGKYGTKKKDKENEK